MIFDDGVAAALFVRCGWLAGWLQALWLAEPIMYHSNQ